MAEKLKNANVKEIKARKCPQVPKDDPPPEPQENGAAGIGDNGPTPEQEATALRVHHVAKLRGLKRLVDKAKEALDEVKGEFNDALKLAKVDTKIDRKHFTELLADLATSVKDLEEAERVRTLLRTDWDLPVGTQLDLFDRMPQEARDEAWAKSVGYRDGLRGDPCMMPTDMEPRFGPAYGSGWNDGQEKLMWANVAVGRIVDRKPGAHGGPTAAEIARQPEPEDDGAGEDGASDVL